MPGADLYAPLRFLETAYQPDDWLAIFLKSYETGLVAQRVGPRSMVMSGRFQAWLRARNAQHFNVYVSVNSVMPGQRSRTRGSVQVIRHVFLEADRNGPQVLSAIEGRCDLPPPSYVLHSSPNRIHVFWRVTGFSIEHVEAVQKQLANELGTDTAATPCTQTTRLPGFMNHKYAPGQVVTIEYRDVNAIYAPTDFPTPVAVVAPVATASARRQGSTPVFDPIERARRYLAACPPAVAGEHGDVRTFRICCRLVRGFALDDNEAMTAIAAWNSRCNPAWSEGELREKLRRARRYGRERIGSLLDRSVR